MDFKFLRMEVHAFAVSVREHGRVLAVGGALALVLGHHGDVIGACVLLLDKFLSIFDE